MNRYTAQLAFTTYFTAIVTVEAHSPEQACRNAIARSDGDDEWKSSDHVGDIHVTALCEGAHADPWTAGDCRLPVPDEFSEHGPPPLITLDPLCPHGSMEVTSGKVRFCFRDRAASVTTEVSDPPPPPQNKPIVTVTRRPDGTPDIDVRGGKAIVRVEGWQQPLPDHNGD